MGIGCIICTEDFISSENEDKLPMCIKSCGHVFHKSCLNIWLGKSLTCPICRNPTFNNGNYVTKLHFQNLSLDNSNILGLLDETDKLRDEIKKKDEIIAKRDRKIADMIKSFSKLSSTFSAVKLDFKEESNEPPSSSTVQSSDSPTTTGVPARQRVVRLVSSRAIQGRAPIPSLEAQLRRARVAAATARTSATLAARGRSTSNGNVRPTQV